MINWTLKKPHVSTRLKFRHRRLTRLMLRASFKAGLPYVGRPNTIELHAEVYKVANAAVAEAAARYDHLFD